MRLRTQSSFQFFLGCALGLVVLGGMAAPAAQAQKITVESADPPMGEQGTVNLDVRIKGKGFKSDSVASFLVTGTANPGGITVKNTQFVSATELVANIDIADTAELSSFDIVVQSNGRTGKGIELFAVVQKGGGNTISCVVPQPVLTTVTTCTATAPGCLDLSFGLGGKAGFTSDVATGTQNMRSANAIIVQPDGKIVLAGAGDNPNGSGMTVARLNSDGTLDSTFGNGGISVPGIQGSAYSAHLQADGKILLAGGTQVSGKGRQVIGIYLVARLNSDGSLDGSFGSGGIVSVDFGSKASSFFNTLAIQGDGKIVAASGQGEIARFLPNGVLDSTFGAGGKQILSVSGGITSTLIQPVFANGLWEERILLAGRSGSQSYDQMLLRLTPTGDFDPSFGPSGTGKVTTDFCGVNEITRTVAIDSAGGILVGGTIYMNTANFMLSRYTADGMLDTTFGETLPGQSIASGRTIVDFFPGSSITESLDESFGLAIQPNGAIVMSGSIEFPNWAGVGLVRFLPNGEVDTSFGQNGMVALSFGFDTDFGRRVALQRDGKIVVHTWYSRTSPLTPTGATYDIGVFRIWQ